MNRKRQCTGSNYYSREGWGGEGGRGQGAGGRGQGAGGRGQGAGGQGFWWGLV